MAVSRKVTRLPSGRAKMGTPVCPTGNTVSVHSGVVLLAFLGLHPSRQQLWNCVELYGTERLPAGVNSGHPSKGTRARLRSLRAAAED